MNLPDYSTSRMAAKIREHQQAAAISDPVPHPDQDIPVAEYLHKEPDVSAYAGGEGGCTRGAILVGLVGLGCVVGIAALLAWWMGGGW